jgi:BlaI family penicillinase repressor
MAITKLSKAETRIIEQYWKLGTSSVREILDSLPDEERVAYTTVQTLVYRLEQNGALRKVKKIGNAQLFEAAIDQGEFRGGLGRVLLELFGGSPRLLVSVSDEAPQHPVSLQTFALGKYDVTRGEFAMFIRLAFELTLCVLWFHPLVWITGDRLALYRELSCDENVIRGGLGRQLLSALGKLAQAEEEPLLRATATSLISRRLARLTEKSSSRLSPRANALLYPGFAAMLVAGVIATVAHTACCFILKS